MHDHMVVIFLRLFKLPYKYQIIRVSFVVVDSYVLLWIQNPLWIVHSITIFDIERVLCMRVRVSYNSYLA